jgi:hypothetical protein
VARHAVYRDGRVHVLAERCASCIFRSVNDGRIKGLAPGRVSGMVLDARRRDSVIPCHSTIYSRKVRPAVCRGFFNLPQTPPTLRLAVMLGIIVYDPAPPKDT